MRTRFAVILACLVCISIIGMSNRNYQQKENEVIATYNGLTDDNMFKFTDLKAKVILFYEISDDVEIDLYDDDYIGQKFKITWDEVEHDEYDEYGDPTGTTFKAKRILKLEEQ
ncbi:MAG: hypothetical protein K9J13_00060 [Saprospiraceae bacterium]|nr:hypothetical protein [Saprospiraceae bacterium]